MNPFDGSFSVMHVGDDLEIVHADPKIKISTEMMDRFKSGYGHPAVSLVDDVLTIHGTNRTVVYRINGDKSHDGFQWWVHAEWPD